MRACCRRRRASTGRAARSPAPPPYEGERRSRIAVRSASGGGNFFFDGCVDRASHRREGDACADRGARRIDTDRCRTCRCRLLVRARRRSSSRALPFGDVRSGREHARSTIAHTRFPAPSAVHCAGARASRARSVRRSRSGRQRRRGSCSRIAAGRGSAGRIARRSRSSVPTAQHGSRAAQESACDESCWCCCRR